MAKSRGRRSWRSSVETGAALVFVVLFGLHGAVRWLPAGEKVEALVVGPRGEGEEGAEASRAENLPEPTGEGDPGQGLPNSDDTATERRAEAPQGNSTAAALAQTTGGRLFDFFQQDAKADQNSTGAFKCEDDATAKVCSAVYRLTRKYQATSILDASCVETSDWMPHVVNELASVIPGFRFVCVANNTTEVERMKNKFAAFDRAEYIAADWWDMEMPSGSDLVFMWDELSHHSYGRAWAFFAAVRRSDARIILVDNYPTVQNEPVAVKRHLNIKRHPFLFPSPKETVYDVALPDDKKTRSLMLYDVQALPKTLLT